MSDPTALLDALAELLAAAQNWNWQRCKSAERRVPTDAIAQLRAALRSEVETEVLRAAIAFVNDGIVSCETDAWDGLQTAVDGLPDDELERLGGEK